MRENGQREPMVQGVLGGLLGTKANEKRGRTPVHVKGTYQRDDRHGGEEETTMTKTKAIEMVTDPDVDLLHHIQVARLISRKFRPLNTDTGGGGGAQASKIKWRLRASLGQRFVR